VGYRYRPFVGDVGDVGDWDTHIRVADVRRLLPARAGTIVNISSIQGVAAWPR
jgi:hypothetical protein